MNTAKFWLTSKTVLFNLALALGGSWTAIEAAFGHMHDAMSPMQFGILMTTIGVIGVMLRIVTTQQITTKQK